VKLGSKPLSATFKTLLLTVTLACNCLAGHVNESERGIPVAYRCDVLVVGGSTGAVSAAVAAARSGAKVFLAAPHPYLGEDMTATLRLWLEPGEKPRSELAKLIYNDPVQPDLYGLHPDRLPFKYFASRPAADLHPETPRKDRLCDGKYASAVNESVQYDGDVTIVADLGSVKRVGQLRIHAFLRDASPSGFKIDRIVVEASEDGNEWAKVAETTEGRVLGNERVLFEIKTDRKARYWRFILEKAPDVSRILVGEIEIIEYGKPAVKRPVQRRPPRPMHVKLVLDQALLDAGVRFLYNCYATDLVVDQQGRPCGIVMSNRAGRQAVLARTIIDATPRAIVARMAGAQFEEYSSGLHTFKRVVIGGEPRKAQGVSVRVVEPGFIGPWPNPAGTSSGIFNIIEYTLKLHMSDGSYRSWMKAEHKARDLTYHPEQQAASDVLFQVPPDPMVGEGAFEEDRIPCVTDLPLAAFRPKGVANLWVLGGCADISRSVAEWLLRPVNLMELGERIGLAAAREAQRRHKVAGIRVAGGLASGRPVVEGDVLEQLYGLRPIQELPRIKQPRRSVPVLGSFDVVVIGGGTSGAAAGIGAARRGAKTLVVEKLYALGGVGTVGLISSYYWGNRVGFTASIPLGNRWVPEQKAEWWRKENLGAGAEVWFGTVGCGAFVQDDRVRGVVVATPFGRGVVLAKVVVDATGNADIAAAAGADTIFTDASDFGMQGTGLPPRRLGATYTNTDFTIADETDLIDIWNLLVYSKRKYKDAFDQGQLVDTRERRRIVGDYTLTVIDEFAGRTFPDTILIAYSNYDTHGYTIHPLFEVIHPEKKGYYVRVPYRCCLPRGLEGLLVGGIGISVHRDALPLVRMQADMQNLGYALGVAGAMIAETDTLIRSLDIKALQKHLIEIGNLPASVLKEGDSFPLPDEKIAQAVRQLQSPEDVAVIMSSPDRAIPLLKAALSEERDDERRVKYAQMLAVLGDASGLDVLIAKVRSYEGWDEGWDYRAMGQFGPAFSELDTLILALGRARNPRALPAILEKAKLLDSEVEFSHHRACAIALELIGDRSAAPVLAAVLRKPGMSGYVHDSIEKAIAREVKARGGTNAVITRRDSLRELLLARALYRCGDYEGLGKKILLAYTKDLRGHLARHAKAILDAAK